MKLFVVLEVKADSEGNCQVIFHKHFHLDLESAKRAAKKLAPHSCVMHMTCESYTSSKEICEYQEQDG